MHLVYCSDSEAFSNDQLRDKLWSRRFPGSGWVTCLYSMAAESGIKVASGDVALENISSKNWSAKDVYVIQEMQSAGASKLLDLGAKPFLITCFEAPLYAPFFYDDSANIACSFKYSLGFGFSEKQLGKKTAAENLPFRFPSFYLEDMHAIRSWQDRRKLVLVAANKYKSKKIFLPYRAGLIAMLRQLRSASWQLSSPAYRRSLAASLHDKRLEVIEYFAARKELSLYGSGWSDFNELPPIWMSRLRDIINDQYHGLCGNKLETLSDYRFTICFENMTLPGYATEKIIDCFVAGTVPIYCGAPDIEILMPEGSFVDMRDFDSYKQLDEYINSMDESDAIQMIDVGRRYLQTEIGLLHSYEGFARKVIKTAASC